MAKISKKLNRCQIAVPNWQKNMCLAAGSAVAVAGYLTLDCALDIMVLHQIQ
jgi:hypothetical protein